MPELAAVLLGLAVVPVPDLLRSPRPVGLAIKLGYGVGSLGTSTYVTVQGLLGLYFLTGVVGMSPAAAGLALSLPSLWGVAIDPAIGVLSDRTRGRWGRRRPWLVVGGVTLPALLVALFGPPALAAPVARAAWATGALTLAALAFSVYQVPYVALAAELAADAHERTVLVAWRLGFAALGTLVAGGSAPALIAARQGGPGGYRLMAIVLAGVCLLAFAGPIAVTRGSRAAAAPRGGKLVAELAGILRDRPFVALLATMLLKPAAVGAMLAALPFFAVRTLAGSPATVTVAFIAFVVAMLVAMPLWTAVSRRTGKLPALRLAVALLGVAALSFLLTAPPTRWLLPVQLALAGLAYGGAQLLPFAILPDLLAADRAATGRSREGSLSGLLTAAEKAGMAAGALVCGLALQLLGLDPGVRVAMAVAPAVLLICCLGVLRPREQ